MKEKRNKFDLYRDFYIVYESFIKFLFVSFMLLIIFISISMYFDKQFLLEKNIIKNTKDYFVYDNCKYLDKKYYCWND